MEYKINLLQAFRAEMEKRCVRLHGAVLMSGGKVTEEVYVAPYTASTKTRMYSTSKSVMAVAIGKLVGEGRLSLDDKIVDIFANRFDMEKAPALLKEQTIRQMLCMTTVYSKPTYTEKNTDWLASYFREKATHPAGSLWYYDSCGSYVLGAVVKQLTGMDFVEYLRPEFDVMGISPDVYCLKGPDGEAWASSGFIATTADLAKVAYLLLNGGKWQNRQLIPQEYARDAISPLVTCYEEGKRSRFCCGYGYQIWGHPDGAFAFRGLGGQVAIGFPDRDLVFACNADTAVNNTHYDDIFEAVEALILPHFPVIQERAAAPAADHSELLATMRGKTYRMQSNAMGLEQVSFAGNGEDAQLRYIRMGQEYCLEFSTQKEKETIFPEAYTGAQLFAQDGYMKYRCSVSAEWVGARKLLLRIWAEDLYVGNMMLIFHFCQDGRLAVYASKKAQFFFSGWEGYGYGQPVCP